MTGAIHDQWTLEVFLRYRPVEWRTRFFEYVAARGRSDVETSLQALYQAEPEEESLTAGLNVDQASVEARMQARRARERSETE